MYLESSALNYELFLSRGRPVLHSQRTLGLFTWHGLFRGPQFGGGGNGAYSSTNLTFQEFVLPWDKNCKWQTCLLGARHPSGCVEIAQASSAAPTCSAQTGLVLSNSP